MEHSFSLKARSAAALLIFLFCGYGIWHITPRAFPFIHIDLTTDRATIIEKARTDAHTLSFEHIDHQALHTAVSFESDIATQTFIELEAGGKEKFIEVIEQHWYEPYLWKVRFFVPHTLNELFLFYTPTGTLYGFSEKISEAVIKSNISVADAQQLAEQSMNQLHIPLASYVLVAPSSQTHPAGRIDHTFVYERTDITLGTGTYRCSVTIAGNTVSELTQFVHVPESFTRTYQTMRSYNQSLGMLGYFLMVLLYLLGGCLIGLYMLGKKGALLWRPALLCGIVIATLQLLAQLNEFSLIWMYYTTIITKETFLLRTFLFMLIQWGINSIFFALVISVAEGLTRITFGDHPQLWTTGQKGCANSTPLLEKTVCGYLLCTFDLLLVSVTYAYATRFLGWWIPSYTLVNPNILSTYVPSLSAIAPAVQAGFIEECLFRAIPLAGSVLLGRYFKKERLFLLVGFMVQIFVFGAAHAHYPAQPFYARLLELIIPSFIWGIAYLRVGLIPIIICHTIYDIVWFSLPLFVSHAPYAWLHQAVVGAISIVPLFVILVRYLQTREWHHTYIPFLNSASNYIRPAEAISITEHTQEIIPFAFVQKRIYTHAIIGLAGLIVSTLCIWYYPSSYDLVSKVDTKKQAQAVSDTFIKNNSFFSSSYVIHATRIPLIYDEAYLASQHGFIWQTQKELYGTLVQRGYLLLPGWGVRYARFDEDIIESAEELFVRIVHTRPAYYVHRIPESRPGASLTQDAAERIARTALIQQHALTDSQIALITATSLKKTERIDWNFEYQITEEITVRHGGQLRVRVSLNGDTVSSIIQYIHVPEEWDRQNKQNDSVVGILRIIGSLLLLFVCIIGFLYAVLFTPLERVSYTVMLYICGGMGTLAAIHVANNFTLMSSLFTTAEPWILQCMRTIGHLFLSHTITTIMISAATLYAVHARWHSQYRCSFAQATVHGLFAGAHTGILLCSALSVLSYYFGLVPAAYAHDLVFMNAHIPALTLIIHALLTFLKMHATVLLFFFLLQKLSYAGLRAAAIVMLMGGATMKYAPAYVSPTYLIVLMLILCMIACYDLYGKDIQRDKRYDTGYIAGIYCIELCVTHLLQAAHFYELIGGIGAIIAVLMIAFGSARYYTGVSSAREL